MNTSNNNTVNTMILADTNKLTAMVDETLALGHHKPFTAAELWNIQRRRRTFVQRRFNA